MILVTGATGPFGRATIEFLIKKGVPVTGIAALIRDASKAADLKEKGVTLRVGDYTNYASLVAAFNGVDKLLLVSGTDINTRLEQHTNVLKAAGESRVKHIVYTSFARKNETSSSPIAFVAHSHIETEKLAKASGMSYTIMRNGLYADMLPIFFGEKVLETGIFLPAGKGKAAYATRQDMAEAAANVLTGTGHENREYEITNIVNYTLDDAADMLSKITAKEISYNSPTPEGFIETLTTAGVPNEYIGLFAAFSEAIRQGEFDATHSDLPLLIGRAPTSLEDFLKTVYK
jgi:NAD(P)H dehydrogenase (quinone)